jgi:metal-responsive CopG/Arc/MetJ family transcriptional regulator
MSNRKIAGDRRTSIKISKTLYNEISKEISAHPEWGMSSVSEFVRRAIDHELSARRMQVERKTIELILTDLVNKAGTRGKGR